MLAYLSVKGANMKHSCEKKKEKLKLYVVLPAPEVYYNLQLFVLVECSETFQQILKLLSLRKSILSFSPFKRRLLSQSLIPSQLCVTSELHLILIRLQVILNCSYDLTQHYVLRPKAELDCRGLL